MFAHVDRAAGTRTRCALLDYDPEPGVPKDVTPMAQCAFECSVFKVSAVHTTYRSWLRSSSTYEPSDPPIKLEFTFTAHTCAHIKKFSEKRSVGGPTCSGLIKSRPGLAWPNPVTLSHRSHGRSTQATVLWTHRWRRTNAQVSKGMQPNAQGTSAQQLLNNA